MFENLIAAVQSGNWWAAASALVIAIVWALRTYAGARWSWLRSDPAGVFLAFATSLAGGLFVSLMAGSAMSMVLVVVAAKVAFGAIGGHSALKKLIGPLSLWAAEKLGLLPPPPTTGDGI